jgi:hypothetical protein
MELRLRGEARNTAVTRKSESPLTAILYRAKKSGRWGRTPDSQAARADHADFARDQHPSIAFIPGKYLAEFGNTLIRT